MIMANPKPDKRQAESEIRNILQRVVNSVHTLDYEAVRDLIPDDGIYYGSVAIMARGYAELKEKQFSKVWPNVDEFKMLPESMHIQCDENIAWAICLFASSTPSPEGPSLSRKGRMTFIFEKRGENWIMVHSHDSLYPVPPGVKKT
jgi:ketosteroid isomerase-like protein